MKKTVIIMTLAALICSGCTSAPADTAPQTSAAVQTEAEQTTTAQTTASEETTTEAQTTAAQTTTAEQTTAANDDEEFGAGKTELRYTFYSGSHNTEMPFYEEDSVSETEIVYEFDYAYFFPAQGIYDDGKLHPEAFDADNYEYKGEVSYISPQDCRRVTAGDTAGNAVIKSAETVITRGEYSELMSMTLNYDGEYELTGVLRYFAGDDYNISAGDIIFYPDGSIEGFPLPASMGEPRPGFGAQLPLYCEISSGLRVGNVIEGRSAIFDADHSFTMLDGDVISGLNGIIGTGTQDVFAKVKVTLSDVVIEWSEQFGMARSRAFLKGIELLPEI